MENLKEAIENIIESHLEDGGGCVEGPDWEWDKSQFDKIKSYIATQILTLIEVK